MGRIGLQLLQRHIREDCSWKAHKIGHLIVFRCIAPAVTTLALLDLVDIYTGKGATMPVLGLGRRKNVCSMLGGP